MACFQRLISFNSSPEVVFAGLTCIEGIPEWISSIRRAYLTSLAPVKLGTTFVQDTVFMSWSFPIAGEVTVLRPFEEFGYVYAKGIVAGVWNYHLTPLSGGTMLLISVEFTEEPGLMGLLKRLLRPVIRLIISRNMDSFRRWVEKPAKYG